MLITISKTVISGGFTGIYIITAEMFPSEMRTASISILNSSGKLIGMLTPFIAHFVSFIMLCLSDFLLIHLSKMRKI